MNKQKALFFSQYFGQYVYLHNHAIDGVDILDHSCLWYSMVADGYLLLRSISQLNDDEMKILGKHSHRSIDNLSNWAAQYLTRCGFLLPFTYLNENNKPITLQTDEIINLGWCKLTPSQTI